MALRFGKYRYSNIKGEKGSDWNIEIWKKNNADVDAAGNTIEYPIISAARNFSSGGAFTLYWNGASNWAFTSDNGGAARHTTGSSDALIYDFAGGAILESGVAYEVTIELASVTAGSVQVKLGTAATALFNSDGTKTEVVTANGGVLSIDPLTAFAGDVKSISLKKYFAPALEFDTSGEGFEITWNGSGGTRDREFLGSECQLNYIVQNDIDENFLYNSFALGYKEYFIRIYRGAVNNDNIWWYGWIQPAFDAIENAPYPYQFNLTATDSYGFWGKQKDKLFSGEDEKNAPHSIKDILVTLGSDMDIKLSGSGNVAPVPSSLRWLRTSLDWWREGDTYDSNNPALLYFVSKGFVSQPTNYNENNEIVEDPNSYKYKAYDVFNGVLKSFNTVGFLAEGHYNFIQPNSLADNTSGDLKFYGYFDTGIPVVDPSETVNTLLTIDQSSNVLLQGSTISYEPSFERVVVNHKGGFSNFNVGSGQYLNNSFFAGALQAGLTGELTLSFSARYYERVDPDDFNFTVAPGTLLQNYTVNRSSFLTTGTLTMYIDNGITQRWLKQTVGSNILTWQNTATTISVERGYAASDILPVNNNSFMATGPISNIAFQSGGPCSSVTTGSTSQQFWTDIIFNATVEQPDISGNVYIQFTCDNDYYQMYNPTVSSEPVVYGNINDPTPGATGITSENITLIPTDNNQDNDVSNGIIYTASQTNNTSIEQFDLGDVNLGTSPVNNLYSFQYNSGTTGSPFYEVAGAFRRNNSGDYKNISQLLVTEFLQFQIEPLEILQAEIQSANISPLRLVKYSINNDGSFKYYQFLGGTFKAQSEILSGEWYKVNSITTNITEENTPNGPTPQDPFNESEQYDTDISVVGRGLLNDNSYGKISSDINNGTTYTKVTLTAASKGKIYNGQKLVLTYPNGSHPLVLTAAGDSTTSDTQIDLSSFTLNISYPIGSVLSPLLYDFTNVITPTPNLYKGVTTTAIYIKPDEFVVTSSGSISMYSRDEMASVQPSSYVSRSHVYATSFIPENYKLTKVNIYSDTARGFTVLEGSATGSGTSSIDTGNSNTELTLSSPWTSILGKYIILEFNFGSTDKIYGAKLTIEAV